MLKNKKIFSLFLLTIIMFFTFWGLDVQASNTDILGTEIVNNDIILKAKDPRTIVTRIINVSLGLLAVIAVGIVIFAGFKWMTSNGEEEKVNEAKKMLKNGVIGLAIILASWGIVTFIFRQIETSKRKNGEIDSGNIISRVGLGAIGNCAVESVYPEPDQKNVPRNTSIMVTFKTPVDEPSVSSSTISVCEKNNFNFEQNTCSSLVPINVNFAASSTILIISPISYLGNEDGNTDYVVHLSGNIKKSNGDSIFSSCPANDYFLWGFEVGNFLDLTSPTIKSIFPPTDNVADSISIVSNLAYAKGSITVISQPNYFVAAKINSVVAGSNTSATTASINDYYNGDYTHFNVTLSAGEKALLKGGKSSDVNQFSSLGAFDIINNKVEFANYFTLNLPDDYTAGNSWNVSITKRQLADTLKVGDYIYTFVNGPATGYNISINADSGILANNIKTALSLSNNPDIEIDNTNNDNSKVALIAKTGGMAGNDIILSSSNTSAISISSFSGGSDSSEKVIINDKEDQPMNSIVQINFSEVVNPSTVVGESDEVENIIKIVNNNGSALGENSSCTKDSDCLSYKCADSKCVGNSLAGSFSISSNYKTVEFKSNIKCGVNGCGEDIFCLPANSNLKIDIKAASLAPCSSNDDCSTRSPFTTCSSSCNDGNNHFYPLADLNNINGVIDAANNSLDGNSDTYAQGPGNYFNKNTGNQAYGDNFIWSFWINNKVNAIPPVIESIYPNINAESVNLVEAVKITFNKLMMSSTLKTGEIIVNNGVIEVTHRLINLISGQLVGYWMGAENEDINPLDGNIDRTTAYINHAKFFEGSDYTSQVGSGVKDIYQNCFKPSGGPSVNGMCEPTPATPFCCNGEPKVSCD